MCLHILTPWDWRNKSVWVWNFKGLFLKLS